LSINKLKLFLKPRKRPELLRRSELEELVRSIIEETKTIPIKPVNPVEQYSIDDEVFITISNRNGILEYVVSEPRYDDRTIYAVTKIYLINPRCKDLACIQEVVAGSNDEELYDAFNQQPLSIAYYYKKVASGYGALYPLIRDPYIEEIAGSAEDERFSVIHRRYSWYGWMNTNIAISYGSMDRIVLSLARKTGRHLSLAHPVVEGLTEEGLRISLTYGREVSRKGSSLVIRKKPPTPWTITKLIDAKALSSLMAAYLWLIMELRGAILIVGGVSSGKTTMLQALLTLIPPSRRVVTIEDTPEITGTTGYWDPLVERVVSIGESSSIDMYSLLKFSLRRRADYLVVGEVRGVEARLLVQASRLGHGILATMHAENAESAIERLVAPPISIPKNMLSNIWCIVVMESDHGVRRVKGIYEVDKRVRIHRVFYHRGSGLFEPSDPSSVAESSHRLRNVLDPEDAINELVSRTVFLEKMVSNGVLEFNMLSEELGKFYYDIVESEVLRENAS